MTRHWREYLADIVTYCEVAARIADEHQAHEIEADIVLRLALDRALEIVGEAAGKVPMEIRDRYPDIPWRDMIGARNRIAHGYFNLNSALLWLTAKQVIPRSLARLREIARLEQSPD